MNASLDEMMKAFNSLKGPSFSASPDHHPTTTLPPYGIELVGFTKGCSTLTNFPNVLLVEEYQFGAARSVNHSVIAELQATGELSATEVSILLHGGMTHPTVGQPFYSGTNVSEIIVTQFAVISEDDKGVQAVGQDKFYSCHITSVFKKNNRIAFNFKYVQYLCERLIIDPDGKKTGNLATSADFGSGEVGKLKKT